jgi:folate-dependent phosphoribosylglycinamide formyltransferase PurN
VNGTRIIGPKTLGAVECWFINTHAGITPAYRGVHGGYWALAEGRADQVGTTVHLVDGGVDTGPVIARRRFEVTPRDNFATYPYLHTAAGIPPLLDAVHQALTGSLAAAPAPAGERSVLRHHPTLWTYLRCRLWKQVA